MITKIDFSDLVLFILTRPILIIISLFTTRQQASIIKLQMIKAIVTFSGFTISLGTAVARSSIATDDSKENILEVSTNHTIDHESISSVLGYSEPT